MSNRGNVIYSLVSKSEKIFYIGKTKQGRDRLAKHKHDYKRWKNGNYGFCSSFKVIECPDCEFVVLRTINDAEDVNEAEKKAIKYHRTNEHYRLVNIMHNY